MTNIVKVIQLIMKLLPYILEIIEFLEGLREIQKVSGHEVAKQIAVDAATISRNWKSYLASTRGKEVEQLKDQQNG